MIDTKWDDLLQKLLNDAEKQEIAELSMQPLTPSTNFEREMKTLIGQYKKAESRKYTIRILYKAAIILLIIVTTLSSAYIFSPTARAVMQNIIRIIYPDHNSYRFGTQKIEIKKGDYSLGYIPEGFEPVEEEDMEGWSYSQSFKDKEDNRFIFTYQSGSGRTIGIDNEHMTHEDIVINEMEGIIAYSNDEELFTVGLLSDDGIVLEVTADLDKETVIKILENIQKHRK